jgi:hypothetical protein
VATIPTFRGIVVQVRIFRLKRAKMPFSARKLLLEMAFLPFSGFQLCGGHFVRLKLGFSTHPTSNDNDMAIYCSIEY